jgi:hypothetical protein
VTRIVRHQYKDFHKYNAKPTIVDGIRFDSKKEAEYYVELKLRVSQGEVKFFLRQVPIHLTGGVRFIIDFQEFHADGTVHFVDVKGVQTAVFKIKKTQAEALYPITIEIV